MDHSWRRLDCADLCAIISQGRQTFHKNVAQIERVFKGFDRVYLLDRLGLILILNLGASLSLEDLIYLNETAKVIVGS